MKLKFILYSILLYVATYVFSGCTNTSTTKTSGSDAALKSPTEITSDSSEKTVQAATTYKKYEGAWFTVEYPEGFIAEDLLKSSTNDKGYDSAWFTSPDGKVRFYVYSPQWNGNPSDIQLLSSEKLVDEKTETSGASQIKRWTVADNGGKYFRSHEQTTNTLQNKTRIFGIQYKDEAALNQYRDNYLHFKNSLQQFAD